MSFAQNKTRIERQKDVENIIAQWPRFDEAYLLQSEMGLPSSTFANAVSVPNLFYDQQKFGKVSSTLNPYRGLRGNRINFEQLFQTERPILAYFPLSLYKFGVGNAVTGVNRFDLTNWQNCDFGRTRFYASFASYVKFNQCRFTGSLNRLVGERISMVDSLFEGCTFNHLQAQGFYTFDSVFKNCFGGRMIIKPHPESAFQIFMFANMEDCHFPDITIEGVSGNAHASFSGNFIRSSFNYAKKFDVQLNNGFMHRCSFLDSNIDFVFGPSTLTKVKLTHTDFSGAFGLFRMLNNNVHALNCTFDNTVFTTFQIASGCIIRESSFRYATLPGSFSLSGVDIRGCDFTGSNINTIYATKADLKAAVSAYDLGTLWIDGTAV